MLVVLTRYCQFYLFERGVLWGMSVRGYQVPAFFVAMGTFRANFSLLNLLWIEFQIYIVICYSVNNSTKSHLLRSNQKQQNLLIMSCNYCHKRWMCHDPQNYSIEKVKPRFIMTYYHSPIFTSQDTSACVRCTPTFHSKVMNVEGYGKDKKIERPMSATKNSLYRNQSVEMKQKQFHDDCCRCSRNCTKHLWYDTAKEDLFSSLNFAQERKQADLSSNPVFGGNYWQPAASCEETTAKFNVNSGQQKLYQDLQKSQSCEQDEIQNDNENDEQQKKKTVKTTNVSLPKNTKKNSKEVEKTKRNQTKTITSKPKFTVNRAKK